jgi:pyruvate carboxylase
VFEDYAGQRRQYGDVSVIPTPVFFYGMDEETEIAVAIERGKTLFIRHLATSEPDAQGERRVFFELNGQPRSVNVADRTAATTRKARPKAEQGNPQHVAAPMPGVVVSVNVQEGQKVTQGDPLLSIEAMKMETVLHAEYAGVVEKILAPAGTQVDSKDLLVILQSAS